MRPSIAIGAPLALLCLLLSSPVWATTYTVSCCLLQDIYTNVAAAQDGDEVYINPGTYVYTLGTALYVTTTRNFTVTGDPAGVVIVLAGTDVGFLAFTGSPQAVTLANLVLRDMTCDGRNEVISSGPGVLLTAINVAFVNHSSAKTVTLCGSATMTNCVFDRGQQQSVVIEMATASSRLTMNGCTFSNNLGTPSYFISAFVGIGLLVQNTTFSGNTIANGISASIPVRIENSHFLSNSFSGNMISLSTSSGSFINNTISDSTGPINANSPGTGASLLVAGCSWKRMVNQYALYTAYNTTVVGSSFTASTSMMYIYATETAPFVTTLDVRDCVFAGGVNAGAVATDTVVATMTNTTFTNVYTTSRSIVAQTQGSLFMANCTFVNNTVSPAAVTVPALTIDSCTFVNNTNTGSIGGLVSGTASATVTNSVFSRCRAPNSNANGGAIKGFLLTVVGSTFSQCSAGSTGGAISATNAVIQTSGFFANTANNGGAVYAGAASSLSGVDFADNVAVTGAAISFGSGTLTLRDVTCTRDRATNSGGCVFTPIAGTFVMDIQRLRIDSTFAPTGAGLYLNRAVGTIADVTITRGFSSFSGGGMYLASPSGLALPNLKLLRLSVSQCWATGPPGGAAVLINTLSGNVRIVDSVLSNNNSTRAGGAINAGGASVVLTLINTTLSGNTAGTTGGAVMSIGANLAFINSTIVNNVANQGGGLYVNCGTYNLTGTTVISCNNATTDGHAIYCTNSAIASVDQTVSVIGSSFANASTDVVCAGCLGNCYGCGRCNGGCGQAGPYGCTTASASCIFVPYTCPALAVDSSVGITTGCPGGYNGQACTPVCGGAYTMNAAYASSLPLRCHTATPTWTPSGPLCVAITCPAVTSVPSHATSGSCGIGSPSNKCTLGCQDGYTPTNVVNGTCTIGDGVGVWSGQDVSCLPVTCPVTSTSAANANAGSCGVGLLGTSCALGCSAGFAPASNLTSGTCVATTGPNAVWVGQSITCLMSSCAAVGPSGYPVGGNFGNCSVGNIGDICYLGCANGYTASTRVKGTCTAGSPSAWTGMLIQCTAATCAAATGGLSANAIVGTCTSNGALADTCSYGCDIGYYSTAMVQGTCTPTGPGAASWMGQSITCAQASCAAFAGILPPSASVGNCSANSQGANCQLSCASGFVPSGATLGTCVAVANMAQWTGLDVTCTPATCAAFTSLPANALVGTCTAGGALGDTCLLTCGGGFVPTGVVQGTCSPAGVGLAVWKTQNITCVPYVAPATSCTSVPSYPPHANPGSCQSAALGASCTLSCNDGYMVSNMKPGACATIPTVGATWVNQTITCTAALCPAPTSTPQGILAGSCGVGSLYQTCQLICEPGYITSNVVFATCVTQDGGTAAWTVPQITCTPVNCAPPMIPSHAVINSCGASVLGSTCSLDCANGYQATSIGRGVCQGTVGANAQWVNASITCLQVGTVCDTYSGAISDPHGNVGTCLRAAVSSQCQLGCAAGYIPNASTGTCRLDSGNLFPTWHGLSVTCSPASCSVVTSLPPHATAGNCTAVTLGASCMLGCANGYVPASPVMGRCAPDSGPTAVWVGQNIQCPPASCPDAAGALLPANGGIGSCQSAALGDTCTLECHQGADQMGTGQLTCTAGNGPIAQWTVNDPITCTMSTCDKLMSLPAYGSAGTCLDGGAVGATCTIGCVDGYNLTTSTPGVCTVAADSTVMWTGATGTCEPVYCPAVADDLSEGYLAGTCGTSQLLGATCELQCPSGQDPVGSNMATCVAGEGAEAVWANLGITCQPHATATNAAITNPDSGASSGLSGGATAGIVIVVLLLVAVIAVLAFLAFRRKQHRHDLQADSDKTNVFQKEPVHDEDATRIMSGSNDQTTSLEKLDTPNPIFSSGTSFELSSLTNASQTRGSSHLRGSTLGLDPFASNASRELSIQVEEAVMKSFDEFELVRELGAGSAGPVMLVREKSTYTEMVFKVYRQVRVTDTEHVFRAQAAVAMNLSHKHITACFGTMKRDLDVGVLTEFMGGGPLTALKLKPAKKLNALVDACKGLAYVHTRKVVHGNVKPGNILIDVHGTTKLADFSMGLGENHSEAYDAPEVLSGGAPTATSDVFSFGLTIGEVMGGRVPFSHMVGMRRETPNAAPWEAAVYDTLHASLRAVIDRCLNADPAQRITAGEIIEALSTVKLKE